MTVPTTDNTKDADGELRKELDVALHLFFVQMFAAKQVLTGEGWEIARDAAYKTATNTIAGIIRSRQPQDKENV